MPGKWSPPVNDDWTDRTYDSALEDAGQAAAPASTLNTACHVLTGTRTGTGEAGTKVSNARQLAAHLAIHPGLKHRWRPSGERVIRMRTYRAMDLPAVQADGEAASPG